MSGSVGVRVSPWCPEPGLCEGFVIHKHLFLCGKGAAAKETLRLNFVVMEK